MPCQRNVNTVGCVKEAGRATKSVVRCWIHAACSDFSSNGDSNYGIGVGTSAFELIGVECHWGRNLLNRIDLLYSELNFGPSSDPAVDVTLSHMLGSREQPYHQKDLTNPADLRPRGSMVCHDHHKY